MKNIFTLLITICAFSFVSAQLTIKAPNGDVGIGTDAPGFKLAVNGDTYSKDGYYMSNPANNLTSRFHIPGNNVLVRHQLRPVTSNKASGFYLSPNGTGTTAGSNTFFALFSTDFGSNSSNFEIMQLQAGASNSGINMRNNGSATLREFALMTNYTKRMVMTTDGRFGFGTTTPNSTVLVDVAGGIGYNGTLTNTSDKRLKKDISVFEYGLEEILSLEPINYSYNGKAGTDSNQSHVGIFAQDLQKLAPELVGEFTYSAPEYTVVEDQDGDEFPTLVESKNKKSEKYLNIKESAIKYMLINAVKEQQMIIDSQNGTIEDLKSKISSIEKKLDNLIKNADTGNIDVNIENESTILKQNEPNPFSDRTEISYNIGNEFNSGSILIQDISGKLIKEVHLDNTIKNGKVSLNTKGLNSGTFVYSLIIDGRLIESKKMISAN